MIFWFLHIAEVKQRKFPVNRHGHHVFGFSHASRSVQQRIVSTDLTLIPEELPPPILMTPQRPP